LVDAPSVYQHLGLAAEPSTASDQSFASGFGVFDNSYDPAYASWSGFAYSRDTDTTTAGFTNQFSVIAGGGAEGSTYFALASAWSGANTTVTFPSSSQGYQLSGAFFTNTTYAYLSMRDGDSFAKKFGGTSGTDPDWFRLDVVGVHADGTKSPAVEVYLADFRSDDSAQDYILNQWRWVDLSSLGRVVGLEFSLASSDTGTPLYFALDSVRASL
jgi:hypothetical protein